MTEPIELDSQIAKRPGHRVVVEPGVAKRKSMNIDDLGPEDAGIYAGEQGLDCY